MNTRVFTFTFLYLACGKLYWYYVVILMKLLFNLFHYVDDKNYENII